MDTRGFRSVYLTLSHVEKRHVEKVAKGGLEVPVLVLGVHGLTNHVGGAGAGEEVVVLVSVRGQRRQDRRRNVGHGRRNMFNILNLKPLS